MQKDYDVIIVGAGPTGYFAAYELMLKAPTLKVLLIDKGHNIYDRRCPILEKKIVKCPTDRNGYSGCKPSCSITSGFGGSGAYSDGKFNITSEFGGWMDEYLSKEEVLDLIKYVDNINLKHGAPKELTDPDTEEVLRLEKLGMAVGLKLLRSQVRHLGTEINLDILKNIYEEMNGKIEYRLDKTNIIHVPIGKVSFGTEKLLDNFQTLMGAIIKAKPAAAKGQYLRSISVSSTMGPGVKINPLKVDA